MPETEKPTIPEYVTVAQIAERTGLSAKHISRLVHTGKIPAVKIGHDYLIRSDDAAQVSRRRKKKGPK